MFIKYFSKEFDDYIGDIPKNYIKNRYFILAGYHCKKILSIDIDEGQEALSSNDLWVIDGGYMYSLNESDLHAVI